MESMWLLLVVVLGEACLAQSAQNITRRDDRIKVNRPAEENGSAFESDIILTPQQAKELAEASAQGTRRRRQATKTRTHIWPKGIIVYKFDESFPNHADGRTAKTNIAKAMKMWEDATCLRFRLSSPSVTAQVGHSSVVNMVFGHTCQAVIGKQMYGNELEVGGSCIREIGSIAHELAHAAGLFHEHSRPDRDNNINVYRDHAVDYARDFFNKRDMTMDQPYDVESIMHYGPLFFSKDGKTFTILPKDMKVIGHMGQRDHLSFNNIKTINDLYQCNNNCPSGVQCKNGGFIGANCACTCPLDLTGRDCSEVKTTSSECGGTLTGAAGKFSTPGFPREYPTDVTCTWLIQGHPGSTIRLRFSSFDLEKDNGCQFDYVDVKVYGPGLAGQRFCNSKPSQIVYRGSALVVRFRSDDKYTYNGFEAYYSIQ